LNIEKRQQRSGLESPLVRLASRGQQFSALNVEQFCNLRHREGPKPLPLVRSIFDFDGGSLYVAKYI
jgi:hypothetical protein